MFVRTEPNHGTYKVRCSRRGKRSSSPEQATNFSWFCVTAGVFQKHAIVIALLLLLPVLFRFRSLSLLNENTTELILSVRGNLELLKLLLLQRLLSYGSLGIPIEIEKRRRVSGGCRLTVTHGRGVYQRSCYLDPRSMNDLPPRTSRATKFKSLLQTYCSAWSLGLVG